MAPEVAQRMKCSLKPDKYPGVASYDTRIDTYSLGVILYSFVTKEPVFDGTDKQVISKTMTQSPKFT